MLLSMSNQVGHVYMGCLVMVCSSGPRLLMCGDAGTLTAAADARPCFVRDQKGHAEWCSNRPLAAVNISPFSFGLTKSIRVCARWKEEIKGYTILALIWPFDLKAAKYRTGCRKVEKRILTLFLMVKKRFFSKFHHLRSMGSIPKYKCLLDRVSFKVSQNGQFRGLARSSVCVIKP